MEIVTRSDAKERILRGIPCTDYLTKAPHGGYVCPYCGSGTRTGTGAVKYYGETNTCACHACPEPGKKARKFDVLDLIQHEEHCDFNKALRIGAERLGLIIPTGSGDSQSARPHPSLTAKKETESTPAPAPTQGEEQTPAKKQAADYTAYYERCRQRIDDPAAVMYITGRGISMETAKAHGVGFDPTADPANAPGALEGVPKLYPAPRLIFPTRRSHYVARAIDAGMDPARRVMNPSKEKGAGSPGIFNVGAFFAHENKCVFVVEGVFDALSIMEAGAPAVALNSASNGSLLVEGLKKRTTHAELILCPDNDPDPATRARIEKQFNDLSERLAAIGVSNRIANICGDSKDANDALRDNREKFVSAVRATFKPDNVTNYINSLMGDEIERFGVEIKTGFSSLDAEIGGLYAGLYVVGAISSLGKTTFCHQMADQIAAAGHDVLFFSLEQSRLEMVSKSLARITAQKNLASYVTSLAIRKGYLSAVVKEAAEQYKNSVADRMNIIEGDFDSSISFIGDYIRRYIARNQCRPVVFIDYLQILQPVESEKRQHQTVREVVDDAVKQMKLLSRELSIPIVVISSLNRTNYLTPIAFESFKESGGIEYTADVIWGLQLAVMNDNVFDSATKIKEKREKVEAAKNRTPREVELKCLKNRFGKPSFYVPFDYYSGADLFKESGGELPAPKASGKLKRH